MDCYSSISSIFLWKERMSCSVSIQLVVCFWRVLLVLFVCPWGRDCEINEFWGLHVAGRGRKRSILFCIHTLIGFNLAPLFFKTVEAALMGAALMHSMVFTFNSVSNHINVLINCSQLSRAQALKLQFQALTPPYPFESWPFPVVKVYLKYAFTAIITTLYVILCV